MSLPLPTNTFTDPTGEKLTYTATQAERPGAAELADVQRSDGLVQRHRRRIPRRPLDIKVTATDTSGLSVSDVFVPPSWVAPAVTDQTPNQTWTEGKTFSLALPANTFTDPQGEALTYTATQQNGQALPGWLVFNATTERSAAPPRAPRRPWTSRSPRRTPAGWRRRRCSTPPCRRRRPPSRASRDGPTPSQSWTDGEAVALTLPANTFTDALGLKMTFAAYEISGPNVTSWLDFNPATDDAVRDGCRCRRGAR